MTTTWRASLGSPGAPPIASQLPRGSQVHGTGTKARWHADDHAGHPAWPWPVTRICRIAGVIVAQIYASPGIFTHALPALRATAMESLSTGLIGNQVDSVLAAPAVGPVTCGAYCPDQHASS